MFAHIRAVLFDLDGTLIDSAPDLGAAADKMRTDRGLPALPLEHYRPMAGAGARGMLDCAFGMPPEHPDFSAFKEEFFAKCVSVNQWVFDIVKRYNGSISAEHGMGMTKRDYLGYSRSAEEIAVMKAVKAVFDPNGIMNPGKIFAI